MAILITILALAALTLIISAAIYRFTFYSSARDRKETWSLPPEDQYKPYYDVMRANMKALTDRPFEWISIRSDDGLTLWARLYRGQPGQPVFVDMHGYRSSGPRDFSGGALYQLRHGASVILAVQRAHFRSGGTAITFGVRERHDCALWAREAVRIFGDDCKVMLCGVSMGAATVLMASDLALPANVRGVIADCPYSEPAAIIRNTAAGMHLPAGALMPFGRLGARLFGGFSIDESTALKSVAATKLPILVIHGDDDRFVPWEMGKKIADAAGTKATFVTVHGAGHALAYLTDPAKYESALDKFMEETLR